MHAILRPKVLSVLLTAALAVCVGVGIAWLLARPSGSATSQSGGPNVPDFSKIPLTPPFAIPTALATPLTDQQRSLEPPPGDLPTPSAASRNAAIPNTRSVPEGWKVYDNPKFQYTIALPPDWQTDMKPEGGYFVIRNAADVASTATIVPGAAAGDFVGMLRIAVVGPVTDRLSQPNTSFGNYPGVTWEGANEADKEYGIANTIHFAFARGDLVFYGDVNLRQEGYSDATVQTVYQILRHHHALLKEQDMVRRSGLFTVVAALSAAAAFPFLSSSRPAWSFRLAPGEFWSLPWAAGTSHIVGGYGYNDQGNGTDEPGHYDASREHRNRLKRKLH